MERFDLGHRLQLLADYGFEYTVAFAVEYLQFLLAEQLGVVEEVLQFYQGFFGAVAPQVESRLEIFAFLVDIVIDGLEAVVALLCLVDGNCLLACLLQTVECYGHMYAVAFNHCLFTLEFNQLTVCVASVDTHDVAHL